ncbi:Secreted RxLR effector peptide protein [Phytophthora palmivora]|uniref:Secreted RxLR effector peptide protein n=1 Tax=Phytophthora palmivora TaxID=4796 RepID=A0A2P4Y4J9_9STRA|nr:Secreted RxLR effector peptide protein [Phytophthora palmivora]
MKLHTVVLGTIVVLLTCCEVFATDKESSQTKEDVAHAGLATRKGGKRLRTTLKLYDTEERGVLSWFKDRSQLKHWVDVGASDDIVMKELGLTGQTGTALMGQQKYKRLQEFWANIEDTKINAMIDDGISTNKVWRQLGLDTLSIEELKNSDRFLTYLRYATKYDDKIFWRNDPLTGPVVFYDGTKEEKLVKVWIWAAADRPEDYVKSMLLLDNTPQDKLMENVYYAEFVRLQLAKKWEELGR